MLRFSTITLFFITVLVSAACGRSDNAPPKDPPPAPTSAEAIPIGPVAGKLLGQPFAIKSARYYVDRRPGYQKIVMKLYGVDSPTPCKDLTSIKPPEVWLRHDGPEHVTAGKTTVGPGGQAPWEVHYQIQEDGRWAGNGDASALFVITAVDPDMKVHAALSACFRDRTGSCVSGTFVAHYCRIWIDAPVRGTDTMERAPGNLSGKPPLRDGAAPGSSAAPAASISPEPHR